MYESFYGLKEKPFNLTPDPDYLYMSPGHENAYSHLEYAIQESKGFVVVTGEVGSGKTTLINYLLRKIPQTIHVGVINNTFVQPQELLRMICHEFDLQYEDSEKTALITRFYNYLLEHYSKRERVILIIDEAQNLPEKTLEEIRMLSNLESEKHHLIQMILVGQPQLKEKLQRKRLEQFVQRVTVYCHLNALDANQVEDYIRHRLTVAGAENLDLFDPEAIKAIYKHSHGIPRLINTICDSAFVYGYADDVKVIGSDLIEAVTQARSLGVREEAQDTFPEEEGKNSVSLPDSTVLLQELEERIRAIEDKLTFQDDGFIKISQRLDALNGHRDERDKIIVLLFKMLTKNMKGRDRLAARVTRLRDQSPPKGKKSARKGSEPTIVPIDDNMHRGDG
jgi:general secretion pathway protein A